MSVPQIVEAQPRQITPINQPPPFMGDERTLIRPAVSLGADKRIAIGPNTEPQELLGLLSAPSLQFFDHGG